MSPNKDETAVHGCCSYLHCSYSDEAGCVHVCRFWPNRGIEFGWFVLSSVYFYQNLAPNSQLIQHNFCYYEKLAYFVHSNVDIHCIIRPDLYTKKYGNTD